MRGIRTRLRVETLCSCAIYADTGNDDGLHLEGSHCNGPYEYAVMVDPHIDSTRIAYATRDIANRALATLLADFDDAYLSRLFARRPVQQRGFL